MVGSFVPSPITHTRMCVCWGSGKGDFLHLDSQSIWHSGPTLSRLWGYVYVAGTPSSHHIVFGLVDPIPRGRGGGKGVGEQVITTSISGSDDGTWSAQHHIWPYAILPLRQYWMRWPNIKSTLENYDLRPGWSIYSVPCRTTGIAHIKHKTLIQCWCDVGPASWSTSRVNMNMIVFLFSSPDLINPCE